MEHEIAGVSKKLINALNNVTNPYISQDERRRAYEISEEYKEKYSSCVDNNLQLFVNGNTPIVRHFGLQLIEYCIKFKWNDISQEKKVFVKNSVLELLASDVKTMFEEAHIKDVLARIVVEMIKREWPQQWPTLLNELNEICLKGELQTELVLLIFLRLAEDVVAFQNVPNQRRREIHQALNQNLKNLISFFMKTIETNFEKYVQLSSSAVDADKQQSLVYCHVADVALKTLAGFVEWIPLPLITEEENLMLPVSFLSNEALRLPAIECLLLILERKGKLEERKPLLCLFSAKAMSAMYSAARSAYADDILHNSDSYLFLKKLCQALTNLGMQLCFLWDGIDDIQEPPTFKLYIDILLEFTKHPYSIFSGFVFSVWICFVKHPAIKSLPPIYSAIPQLMNISIDKLIKVGLPSKNDSVICNYSRLEFDSDEEFYAFFCKLRGDTNIFIRHATVLQPEFAFKLGAETLLEKLKGYANVDNNLESTPSLSAYLDALSLYIDGVCTAITIHELTKPTEAEISNLINALLSFETKDPLEFSSLLSCISALFIFLTEKSELILPILNKIFSFVTFSFPGQTKFTRTKDVITLRKHASCCLIKMSLQQPKLLLQVFDQMYKHVIELCQDHEELNQMEKCSLFEALLILSNEFLDYDKQSAFLKEILTPVAEVWRNDVLKYVSSPEAFVSCIDIDKQSQDSTFSNDKNINKLKINSCIHMIRSVVRRVKWPDNMDVAKRGRYLQQNNLSPDPYLRNPAASHILPLLDGVFSLLRTLNGMHEPSVLQKLQLDFSTILGFPESEQKAFLGIPCGGTDTSEEQFFSPTLRTQCYLFNLYEKCLFIIGYCPERFGLEFYCMPGLIEYCFSSVFCNVQHLPDFRIRAIIRQFLKPLCYFCPPSRYDVIIPILEGLCPFMLMHLSSIWEKFQKKYGSSMDYEDKMTELQEIIEHHIKRQLTRDYINFLGGILQNHKTTDPLEDSMDDDQKPGSVISDSVSVLGKHILKMKNLYPVITCTFFSAIQWPDTMASLKSTHFCIPLFKQLMNENIITQRNEFAYLLQNIILGLEKLGEHDLNQSSLLSLGVLVYEAALSIFPDISNVLLQLVNCKSEELQKFDEKIKQPISRVFNEKRRKDAFKSLVSEIIGKNVGQHFKKEIKIKDLPRLFTLPKFKKSDLLDSEEDLGICSLFVPSQDDFTL